MLNKAEFIKYKMKSEGASLVLRYSVKLKIEYL